MARFFGKNEMPVTRNLISERIKFYLSAYNKSLDGLDQKPIVDFNFAENVYYGRVDQRLDTMMVDPQFVIPISTTNNYASSPQLVDFVADMYSDMVENFTNACRLQTINVKDPFLAKLNAYKWYQDPEKDYRNYMSYIMNNYINNYIIGQKRTKEIMNVSDFINHLTDYSQQLGPYSPFTFTGFQLSQQSSIFNTGLAVSISDIDMDLDESKDNFFIQNEAFQYYLNLAKNIGFSVSKNAPWLLVADLASPAMLPYLAKYNLFSVKDVFNFRFSPTHNSDIDKLLQTIVTYYRIFVNKKPYEKIIKSCRTKTSAEIKYRESINNNTINNINTNDILRVYCILRNIEERNILNPTDLNKLIRDSINYQRVISLGEIATFINEAFVQLRPLQDGGAISTIEKQKIKKDLTNRPKDDTLR